jgi:hypothetical protein
MLLTILVILLFATLLGGVWGTSGGRPHLVSWSPFSVLVLILLVLFLTGNLGVGDGYWPHRHLIFHDRL